MKVLDYFSNDIRLIASGLYAFWDEMYSDADPWTEEEWYAIQVSWFLSTSGCKTLSPFWHRLAGVYDLDPENVYPQEMYEVIAKALNGKFKDKWIRVYDALHAEYNPLDTNVGKRSYTDTHNYDLTDTDNGTVNYGRTTDTTGSSTVNTENEVGTGIYGFNSSTAVDSNVENSNGKSTSTDIGTTTQGGSDTTNGTKKKQGTETTERDEQFAYRDRSGAYLTKEEVKMRIEYLFAKVVLDDVDSMLCLSIYDADDEIYKKQVQLATLAGVAIAGLSVVGGK